MRAQGESEDNEQGMAIGIASILGRQKREIHRQSLTNNRIKRYQHRCTSDAGSGAGFANCGSQGVCHRSRL